MNSNDDTITDTEGLRLIAWSLEGGNIKMADECRRAADEIERLRADRDRWRDLAEYLCQNSESVVVPEWIASRFPDPLKVRGE